VKRILALLLALALCCACLPQITLQADAVTWIDDRDDVDGHDFTKSEKLADKLNSIFDGNASVYKNSSCTKLVDTRIGNSTVPNDGVLQYIGPYGGPYLDAGTSCWIYANGVYYTLFGESTSAGIAGPNSEKLNLYKTSSTVATYNNFKAWGVRNAVGALIRANGHSMIVMGYDENTLTILDGNGDKQGLISLRIRKWSEINFSVSYIIQPKEDYYYSLYPGCEHVDSAGNSLFTDNGTDCGICSKCDYVFDWKSRFDASASGMYKLNTEPYELREKPYANAEKTGALLFDNVNNWEVLGSFTNAYGEKWYGIGTSLNSLQFAPASALRYMGAAPIRVTCTDFSPADGSAILKATYNLEGTVTATNMPLRSIEAYLDGELYATWTAPDSNTMSVSLKDTAINHSLRFSSLSHGKHTILLKAYSHNSDIPVQFLSSSFYVVDSVAKPFDITCTDFAPANNATLLQATYNLTGTVYSENYYIRRIEGYLDGALYATWTASSNIDLVYLKSTVLNLNLRFSSLPHGKHTLVLKAYNIVEECVTFVDNVFFVCSSTDHTEGEPVIEYVDNGGCGTTYSVTYCTVCTAEISRTPVVSEQGHTVQIIPGKAATCTEPGLTDGKGCTACGKTLVQRTEIPATGHNWKDATCTEAKHCTGCGITSGSALGHYYCYSVIVHQPTCTVDGIKTHTCGNCGDTKSETLPATGHTEVQVPGRAPTATVPGLTDGVNCGTCGMVLVPQQGIPATGHTYDHDFDVDCNVCGQIREIEGVFDFVNYRLVFSDPNEMHKNIRVVIYKLGNQSVADPTDEAALQSIDPNAETVWGVSRINQYRLTDAGNYVALLKYNMGTDTAKVPLVLNVNDGPKLVIDNNNKLTVLDEDETHINHRVVIYYLGEQTVADIYDEAALLAIDSAPETVWRKTYINRTALTRGGNYVVHLCWNVGVGPKITVAQQFTVFAIPTLTLDVNNMLWMSDDNGENNNHRLVIYKMADDFDFDTADIYDEATVKAAAVSTSGTYWGAADINGLEIHDRGNYIIHLYYSVGTSAKRTIAIGSFLNDRPVAGVTEDNKLSMTFMDPDIINERVYYYYFGENNAEGLDIYDKTALQAAASSYTTGAIWGKNAINKTVLKELGNYVIHFEYNVKSYDEDGNYLGSAKKVVAVETTVYDPAKPTITVDGNNMLTAASENRDATNYRAVIYNLGGQTVEDPADEAALKEIDPAAVTKWGLSEINAAQLDPANNYVVLLKYNIGTATRTVVLEVTR